MSAVTQPVGSKLAPNEQERAVRERLDALASGSCSQSEFLQSMQERFRSDPEASWEVLSQLDQYFRRGKIKPDVFQSLKIALAGSAVGARDQPAPVVTMPSKASGTPSGTAAAEKDARPAEPARQIKPGESLRGRYRIERVLGQGGMGTVFEAIDEYRLDEPPIGQRIALKVLHTAVTVRTELLYELRREFQRLQQLSHPNIVRVHEFDRDGATAFFTMELLDGLSLSQVLESRNQVALKRTHALAVIHEVGAAVAHAHSRGVVHGDINPQNIFVTTQSGVRLFDFGASHNLPGASNESGGESTQSFATPGYASCQVLEGEQPEARDDIFALACVAYLLLSGEPAFSVLNALDARAGAVRLRRPPELSSGQWAALREGLQWDREDRPADVSEWVERLCLPGAAQELTSSRKKIATGALVAIALAALLSGGYWAADYYGWLPSSAGIVPGPTATSPGRGVAVAPTQEPAPAPPPKATEVESKREVAAVTAPTSSPPAAPPAAAVAAPVAAPVAVPANAPASSAPARIEMAADTLDVQSSESTAEVLVRRKGNMRGEVSFTWWTESGTAKPGTDFVAVVPQVESINNGRASVPLSIRLTNTRRTQEKSFYVVIDQRAEGGAVLGGRTLTMVTLPPTT
jgi:eukaryotic-like serine/threonine-protein kinase